MLLKLSEADQFFRLHVTLMFFVNHRLKVIPDNLSTPEDFAHLPPPVIAKVRDALLANIDLIDSFVGKNRAHFLEEELNIVRSWRHFVAAQFCTFRELKKYTVFLSTTSPHIAYGVLALTCLISALLPA